MHTRTLFTAWGFVLQLLGIADLFGPGKKRNDVYRATLFKNSDDRTARDDFESRILSHSPNTIIDEFDRHSQGN